MPVPTAEQHDEATAYFDLAVLHGTPATKGPREHMWPSKLAEVEAEEARLAAELREERASR